MKTGGTCSHKARPQQMRRHGSLKGHVWEERVVLCVLRVQWEVGREDGLGQNAKGPEHIGFILEVMRHDF